jgi:hypothetical protein
MEVTTDRLEAIKQAIRMVDSGQLDRKETLFALDLVIEYLESAIEDCQALPHLYDLRDALVELNSGIVAPLLQPNKPSNRVPDRFLTRTWKVQAAACCQALFEFNEPREIAARRIARILKFNGRGKLGSPSSTTVLYWRKTFSGELSFELYRGFFRSIVWCGNKIRHSAIDKDRALVALRDLIRDQNRFPNQTDGAFFMHDGKLYQRRQGHGIVPNFSADERDRVQRLVEIRDIVSDLLASRLDCHRVTRTSLQKRLVAAYNAFVRRWGPTTVKSYLHKPVEPVELLSRPNFDNFRSDPDALMVSAIEKYDRDTGTAELDRYFTSIT